ncbi:EAL domain-containing protein [Paracidovorax wautersii]|uniref:Diguanylate cyclase (GGDEF)-like protein/PAS domain S-box-containing protein n=1 Tax=Paracidovorax wautersii TaxID=1177982 RepID=A0ABU1I8U6_9BURK|nr:EAL domain-containing protein [Paracidovorax wautersii]MDR6213645.1 diguanylate cyclase (GGDEF)-like protein/PAS domain S-box-containing protein [Paracidovorax wautersii]
MPVAVLLVDHDAVHAHAAVQALADAWRNWTVAVADSVAHAGRCLAVEPFDVVIAADRLLDGTAFDVLEAAHGLPVLIAVPEGQEAQAAVAMRHGFSDFVVRDAAQAYLLTLPAQIEAVIEHARAGQARRAAEAMLARQHRLLEAISRTQSLFITAGATRAAFEGWLQEMMALTHSPVGFVGTLVPGPGAGLVLQPHAVAVSPEPAAADTAAPQAWRHAAAAAPWPLDRAGSLLAHALDAAGEPSLHAACGSDVPLEVGWPADGPAVRTFFAQTVQAAGAPVAVVGLANAPAGYVRADLQTLQPLLSTLGQMEMARRAEEERRMAQEALNRTAALLSDKSRALKETLDAVAQGITKVDAEGRIRVYNRRYLELLDMPEAFMAQAPTPLQVLHFQMERGDLGHDLELMDAQGRRHAHAVLGDGTPQEAHEAPEFYVRRSPGGRYLEVRTRPVVGGGRVRTFTDVTDYVAAQEAVRASEARWRSLTQLSSDWYWEQDADLRFVRLEGAYHRDLGISETEFHGALRWDLEHSGVTPAQWQAHQAQLEARETFHDFEMQRRSADGSLIWLSISGEPIFDATGRFTGYRGVARNITERKRAEAEIERLAFFDELTGLPNRRLLMDRVERAAVTSLRTPSYAALLFLDLDNFKSINDTLGHAWGDRLLAQVGARLAATLRATDTVARLGGDEFVVVLQALGAQEVDAAIEAEGVAQKLLLALNRPYALSGREVHSTPSIGITLFKGRESTALELLQRADLAMYQAKAEGRNTLCFFDPAMQAAATARSVMEADLRLGLQRAELLPYYQPVVDADGRILGAEALVRWRHPERGMVPPGEFIAVAEQTGLIMPLGRMMLRAACHQLAAWAQHPQTREWSLSVNVSAHEFKHADFVRQVLDALDESGIDPRRLKLELTESLLLQNVEDSISKMQVLRKLGVGFSLDDFGTGYSSLSYLKRLPLDQLKIDQSFVRDVLTDANDAAIACTIVTLAQSLGLDVVAEGVETEGQREFLLRHGCRRFQGYLFGRPAPEMAVPPWTAEEHPQAVR